MSNHFNDEDLATLNKDRLGSENAADVELVVSLIAIDVDFFRRVIADDLVRPGTRIDRYVFDRGVVDRLEVCGTCKIGRLDLK